MVTHPSLKARIAGLHGGAVIAWRRSLLLIRGLASGGKAAQVSAAKPLRPIIVPVHLADLRGPSTGVVTLPVRLYWSTGSRTFDLADQDQVAGMYDAVLDTASTMTDITSFLSADLLVRTWPTLSLGRPKREAWEERFPVLRRHRLAAAA